MSDSPISDTAALSPENQALLDGFARTTDQIVSLHELRERLASGQQLRIKYGVDVTAPQLHTGHAVNLWMMREMQDLGHRVIFLIGDFTTRIGDPTGKSKTRPEISREEIEANAEEFIKQAGTVLRFDDPDLIEIRRNSEWLDPLPLQRFLELLAMLTHARLVSRDMFRERIEAGADIHMHEMLYPVLQGYDSYALESDLTIIGSDQLFNEMLGRFFQERLGQRPQVVITTKITPGIDGGAKQSKSLGNYIGLQHSARDKFGRVMRIPDSLVQLYFTIYTTVPQSELDRSAALGETDPLEAKKQLAAAIVERYHGADVAAEERAWFDSTFTRRETPDDVPDVQFASSSLTLLELVRDSTPEPSSNSAARRLIEGGGVRIEGEQQTDPHVSVDISSGPLVQVGKRRWFHARGPA